jgi:hypothetical protein
MSTEPNVTACAIANADAHLNNVGLPTYTDIVALLFAAQRLGLNFDRDKAYISRAYVDEQDALNKPIRALRAQLKAAGL